jgi:hypothetical protein
LVLAELVAKRGEGPLAPRHNLFARGAARARAHAPLELGAREDLRATEREPT